MTIERITLWAPGRPAPKGSYKTGAHGQVRPASPYLAAWGGEWKGRTRVAGAVERAVYARYAELGIDPSALPLFVGAVGIRIVFLLDPAQRVDGPPDSDKLERATWDALTVARMWEDDARVTDWGGSKAHASDMGTGAVITVWRIGS